MTVVLESMLQLECSDEFDDLDVTDGLVQVFKTETDDDDLIDGVGKRYTIFVYALQTCKYKKIVVE